MRCHSAILAASLVTAATPALSATPEPPTLKTCETSFGSVAIVEGETQGWSEYGLSSPRALINAMATESGCFTPHNPASGVAATFLMNIVAGSKEEVDKTIELAKGAAMQGLVSSGAAGSLLGGVPGGGAMLGAFSAFGGKNKTVAAGIRLISPMNGMTIVSGSGQVKKSSLSFGGSGAPAAAGWLGTANAAGYGDSKNGQMLVEAFIVAFNNVVSQGGVLQAVAPTPKPAAAPAVTPVAANAATPVAN
jgi:hypothetical protein